MSTYSHYEYYLSTLVLVYSNMGSAVLVCTHGIQLYYSVCYDFTCALTVVFTIIYRLYYDLHSFHYSNYYVEVYTLIRIHYLNHQPYYSVEI